MSKRHAPRAAAEQLALDPKLETEDAAERSEALEQVRGNQFARDAMVLGAVAVGPVNDAKGVLEAATDWMREEGAPEAELGGGEGEGGKGLLDPDEDPPADLDDVAQRIEDMADNGVPPEQPDDEGGGDGGDDVPVMRSGDGGGDDVDPEEVRPLIQGSTGSPLPASIAARLGRVLDHSIDHVMLHTDGKAAEAADKVHAHAFALGTHVFFAGGRYQPGTPGGDELLLHELTHVMQYDHGQLRGSSTGDLEVSKPGESAEMAAETAAAAGVTALRAADQRKPEEQVLPDNVHPIGRGSRPENQPMKAFMRGPVLENGVIFREEGEGQEEGGDENWVVAKVREYSPQLADVLTLGVEEVFGDDLMTVIGEWLADMVPEVDLPGLLEDIMGQLSEAGSLLADALAGDMECCKRIAEISTGITESLAFLHSEEGPIKTFESYAQTAWEFLYSLGGGLFDGIVAANQAIADSVGITFMRETVFGFLDWIGDGTAWAIDQVLSAMGWPTLKEIPDALLDKAQGVVDAALEGHLELVDAIAEAIGDTTWFNALADVGDLMVEAGEAAAWFAQNWGDESKWTKEALAENFLILGDAMFSVREAWSDVEGVMMKGSEIFASIQPKLQELVQHPIFCYLACWPLFTPAAAIIALTAYAGAPFWSDLWTGAQTAGSWLLWAGEGLAETIVALTNIANPITALPVLAGILLTFVSWLPDCYQEPIIDLFLLIGSAAGALATMPFVLLGMPLAAVHHATMAFWENLSTRSLEEKVAAFSAVAGILRLSFAVDLMSGFVVGALKGIWDEIVGIVTLVVGAVGLVGAAVVAIPALITALGAIMALSAKGQRDRREANEELDEDEQDPEKVAEGIDTGMEPPPNDLEGKENIHVPKPFDYPSLEETMGGMWQAFEDGAEKMGSALADGVYTFLTSAESTAYTIGEWVGWGVAIIGFEFFLTKGASFLAGLLPKASKLLLKIVQLSEKIDDIIGSLLSPLARFAGMIDDVMGKMVAYMRHIKLPFVDEVLGAMISMKTKIMAFFDELIEKMARHLDELTKSKKGKPGAGKPDAEAPGGKPKDGADGKPKDGEDPDGKKPKDDDDSNAAKAAKKAAETQYKKLSAKVTSTLETPKKLAGKLPEKDKVLGESVRYSLDLDTVGKGEDDGTWGVEATAGKGTEARTRSFGSGWVADPSEHVKKSERMLGKTDAERDNELEAKKLLDRFETAWQDLVDQHAEEADDVLKEKADALADTIEKELDYSNLDAHAFLSNEKFTADEATIDALIVIAPNATEKKKPLRAPRMTLDERLAAIGRGEHKALLKRFTSKDWSTSFKITQGHAQKNIKEARERNPERLYTTDEPRYLYVPIPTDEVAHLMADRVNAVGRNDQRLKDAFGENELIAFCEADRRIGGLDADWDGYAKDALKLLVAEGTLEDLGGGSFSFGEMPAKRVLPDPSVWNTDKLRRYLYINGSKYDSIRDDVREEGRQEVEDVVVDIMLDEETDDRERAAEWLALYKKKLVWDEEFDIDKAHGKKGQGGYYDIDVFEADHIVSLASHWVDDGWNQPLVQRQRHADDQSNLQPMHESWNASKGSTDEETANVKYRTRAAGPGYEGDSAQQAKGVWYVTGKVRFANAPQE